MKSWCFFCSGTFGNTSSTSTNLTTGQLSLIQLDLLVFAIGSGFSCRKPDVIGLILGWAQTQPGLTHGHSYPKLTFFFFLTKVHGLIIPSSLSLSLSPLKKMKITFFFKKKRERYHSDRATTTTVICKVWLWCLLDPRRLLCLSLNVATIYCWALSVSWMTKRKRRLVRENITVGSEFGNGDTYMVVDHWKSSSCERRAQNWRWVFNRFNP